MLCDGAGRQAAAGRIKKKYISRRRRASTRRRPLRKQFNIHAREKSGKEKSVSRERGKDGVATLSVSTKLVLIRELFAVPKRNFIRRRLSRVQMKERR